MEAFPNRLLQTKPSMTNVLLVMMNGFISVARALHHTSASTDMPAGAAQLSSTNTPRSQLSGFGSGARPWRLKRLLLWCVWLSLTARCLLLVALFASLLGLLAEQTLGLGRPLQPRHELLHVVEAVVQDLLRNDNTGDEEPPKEVLSLHGAEQQPSQPPPGPASGPLEHRHPPGLLMVQRPAGPLVLLRLFGASLAPPSWSFH